MTDQELGVALREQLVAAKLAGRKLDPGTRYEGYVFRNNEQAADAATAVFADWLRSLLVLNSIPVVSTDPGHTRQMQADTREVLCLLIRHLDSAVEQS